MAGEPPVPAKAQKENKNISQQNNLKKKPHQKQNRKLQFL